MMTRSLLLSLALAALCAGPLAAQLAVHPVNIEMTADSTPAAATFTVRNNGKAALPLVLSVEDFDQGTNGDHTFGAAGAFPSSCHERLRLATSDLIVEAGTSRSVRIEMLPGSDVCWNVIWVSTLPPKRTRGASIGYRIGVKVYGAPSGVAPDGEIRAIRVSRADSVGARQVIITLMNQGGAVMRPRAKFIYQRADGSTVETVSVNPFSVLPHRLREIASEVPSLPPGTYRVQVEIDYGGEFILGAETDLDVR